MTSDSQVDGVRGNHILIAPPYTVTEDEVVFIVETLAAALQRGLGGVLSA